MGAVPGTLVSFHAHPDDEAIATGGTLARAADEGHRVVLVVATKGEHGEVDDGFLDDGESLAERRVRETQDAARILGVARVEFLGYTDSGMAGHRRRTTSPDRSGPPTSTRPRRGSPRSSARRTPRCSPCTTTTANYDHPDHIQVHRVGIRAAELAATPRVYEATVNRDAIRGFVVEMRADAEAAGTEVPEGLEDPDEITIGVPEAQITTTVDVAKYVDTKRAALAAHASQVDESSFFLAMPAEHFRAAFGQEWFIRRGAPPGTDEDWLFPD